MKYIVLILLALTSGAFASEFDKSMEKATQGEAWAQFNLGIMYANGRGVPENDAEAVKWYRKAADGVSYRRLSSRISRSSQGYVKAQYNLGFMYANGRGVPENDAEAVKWYRKAADQGYAKAQYNLGLMYDNGRGVSKNDAEAVKWYKKAAEQGYADAQSDLGFMYVYGDGVPESHIKAYVWWSMAKANGSEKAKGNIEILKPMMKKEQIAKAQEIGSKCYESSYKDCD